MSLSLADIKQSGQPSQQCLLLPVSELEYNLKN